ncbi:MAG: GtrA family protein [Acidobacteria bacterium]|nr:GtrA family protein [Acidobacteriota bacterium]
MRRWLAFNAVGAMGVAVQLVTLVSLTEALGLNYLVATLLAVETAILHNFVWHEHWTWRDRVPGIHGRWTRLAWFNLVTGAFSISSNLVLTALYVRHRRVRVGQPEPLHSGRRPVDGDPHRRRDGTAGDDPHADLDGRRDERPGAVRDRAGRHAGQPALITRPPRRAGGGRGAGGESPTPRAEKTDNGH